MERQQEFVLRTIEERDIRFVRLWFTDVLGFLKSVAVAPAELEGAFAEGIGFDGSAIEGFARVAESDMLARPDPSTFQVLPWRGEAPGTARMFCDILMPDGTPSYADPRHVLRRVMQKAAELGFTFYVHPEVEFFLLRERPTAAVMLPEPIDAGGYFDQTPHDLGHDFRRQAITMLERMGISVEFSHHEVAPGQQEIDLLCGRPDDRRQPDDDAARRQGGRARAGHLCVVHAQAVYRPAGFGDAHASVVVRR
jgi:glutamine synthetase